MAVADYTTTVSKAAELIDLKRYSFTVTTNNYVFNPILQNTVRD
jgi:hypothetical protein